MPEVARLRPDIAFTLALAPAINWLLQGRYNTRAAMAAAGRMKRKSGRAKRTGAISRRCSSNRTATPSTAASMAPPPH